MDWDSDIKCFIHFNSKKKPIIKYVKWSFLMNNMVKYLYDNFANEWHYIEPYFLPKMNRTYGKLYNTRKSISLINKQLSRNDFEYITENNFLIDCKLFLKSEPDRPRDYTVSKVNLLRNFIKDMYDLHGNDWNYFETKFNDTKKNAYGIVKNNSYRKKNPFLTPMGLNIRLKQIRKEEWYLEKINKPELFYVLYFENKKFIKIGQTYRDIEYRLYNYIFPNSDVELFFYEDAVINFQKSFLLKTDFKRHDTKSFESYIIDKFKIYRSKLFRNTFEILEKEAYRLIISEMRRCAIKNNWEFKDLLSYTGFKNNLEMKKYNISKKQKTNIKKLYNTNRKVKIYLKNE